MKLLDIHEPGESPLPHEGAASVGIDLGTTNSLVAISNNGVREVVCDDNGNSLFASVVAYKKNGEVLVGSKALQEAGAIRSIKRLMGRGVEDIKKIAGELPYAIDKKIKTGMVHIKVGERSLTPVEISAEILKELKKRAEAALENEVDRAVITVPAYFDDAARTATKDAAKLAGLEVLRLVNEPTAAALAYGLDNASEGIYAVYDLGGGTFDISLLKMEKGVFQVLATGGDVALGGDDFDHEIAEYFIKKYGKPESSEISALLAESRKAKEFLTEHENWQGKIKIAGKEHKYELNIETLNDLVTPYIERTILISKNVIEDSGVDLKEIKGVVLVGGSTRLNLVKKQVKELLGREPLSDVDPDKVVAIGAAIQAEALTQGSDTLLLDVTPLSLGIETMGGIVETLIARNTPIPFSHSQKFTTYADGQTAMKIHVLQGEREMVDQCRSLAEFELTGIPSMPSGTAIIEVTFTIDADGLLTVSARETKTRHEQKIEVKPSYGLPPEKIETMLKESMEHAKEDILRKLLAQSKIDANIAINSVKSAMKKDSHLLEEREKAAIEKQIDVLQKKIEGNDRDSIDYEVTILEKFYSPFAEKRVNKAFCSSLQGVNIGQIEKNLRKQNS